MKFSFSIVDGIVVAFFFVNLMYSIVVFVFYD